MGQVSSQQIQSIAVTGASTTVGLLTSLSLSGDHGARRAAALIAVGSLIAGMFKGCGSSCVIASNDANKIEPVLQQNLQAYLVDPDSHEKLASGGLEQFRSRVWNALKTAVQRSIAWSAGQRCISDRTKGRALTKSRLAAGHRTPDGTCTYQYNGCEQFGIELLELVRWLSRPNCK